MPWINLPPVLQLNKRPQSTVGCGPIQKFVGTLARYQATKGVFMTPSGFQKNALEYVRGVQHPIIPTCQRLAQYMIQHRHGVATLRTLALKRVDSDCFDDA